LYVQGTNKVSKKKKNKQNEKDNKNKGLDKRYKQKVSS
jgi:hypothetical protein